MNRLWGGRKDQDDSSRDPMDEERESAANEHTRLLPNRVESTNYLSPDDPAVSTPHQVVGFYDAYDTIGFAI